MCSVAKNREDGVNPSRSRRCNRGRVPHEATGEDNPWEGAVTRVIRKPEDLPRVGFAKRPVRERQARFRFAPALGECRVMQANQPIGRSDPWDRIDPVLRARISLAGNTSLTIGVVPPGPGRAPCNGQRGACRAHSRHRGLRIPLRSCKVMEVAAAAATAATTMFAPLPAGRRVYALGATRLHRRHLNPDCPFASGGPAGSRGCAIDPVQEQP